MSKDPPAHTRRRGAASEGDDEQPSGLAGLRPASVASALRSLAPPKHGPDFWTDLDQRLADEPQLRLAPRSAIRPITQPPPVIDDSNLATALKGDSPPPRRSSRRGALVTAIVVLLAGLGVAAALQDPDDPPGDDRDTATETSGGRTPTSDGEAGATTSTAPATDAPAGAIEPTAPLTPGGVGPLTIGARMADLQAAGLTIESDNELFEGSGGTCWVARVAGALDLELRFRAPDDQGGVEEPSEGVLTAISIESGLPTVRTSNSRIGLGAPQDQVLAAYGGNLDDRAHPFVSGGHIFRADAGNGTGIAFQTDGLSVIGVVVGEMDAIRFINECG